MNQNATVTRDYMAAVAVSAVAIFAGFKDAGIRHMGGITIRDSSVTWHPLDLYKQAIGQDGYGCDYIYEMLSSWATMAHELWTACLAADDFDSVPGVFDYEVSEEFGAWFWAKSFELRKELGEDGGPAEPPHEACAPELGRLVWEFFGQRGTDAGALSRDGGIADAIHAITGYRAAVE
jgi:hypothetical protein